MKLKYMLLALMPLCLASCSEEENIAPDGQRQEVRVTAGVGNDSRMVLSDQGTYFSCLWENSDQISLFTSTQSNLVYRTTIDGNVATAAFTPVDEALEDRDGNTVYACYPDVTLASEGELVVNLPSTATMDYNNGTLRSFAYAESTISDGKVDFKFKHISAFLGLTVTSDMLSDASKSISKMTISTSSTEPLSIGEGDTFDFSTQTLTTTHGSNTVVVNVDNQVVETEWTIYVPILPQPAGADITITLSDSEGATLYTITKQTPEAGFQAGYAYCQGATVSSDVAYLIDGPTFNTSIKDLVNGNAASRRVDESDEKIAKIKFMTEVQSLPEEYIVVSAEDSPVPIYASFNATDSLLTISTAAKNMEIADAFSMFEQLGRLHTIDLGNFKITEKTTNTSRMFYYCSVLTSLDVSAWDTSNVTDMAFMFNSCSALSLLDVSGWNTSNVTDMAYMFNSCSALSLLDVSGWNTSNVTDMGAMFNYCPKLTSLDISGWNTSNVTYMNAMFSNCSKLTSLDVSSWNTSNVTYMNAMFSNCSKLTTLDVSNWDTSNVTTMIDMFNNCRVLTSLDVSNWETSNVINMSNMFYLCSGLTSLNVSNWEISNVTDMYYMFYHCSGLTSLDVSGWDTGNVTHMGSMFTSCFGLTSLDVSNWNTSNVTNMYNMFSNCSGLTSLDVSGWDTSNVTDMSYMFASCLGLSSLDISNWDTGNVTAMSFMFYHCSGLTSLDVSGWNTSNVTNMSSMFSSCSGLTSLDVSGWNTSNVTYMNAMFSNCSGLTSLDVSGWDTGNVTNMLSMFSSCSGLTSLDVSGWDTGNVTAMSSMFSGCSGLTSLDVSGWDTGNVTAMSSMFSGCSGLTSLDISNWSFKKDIDLSSMFYNCAYTSKKCKIIAPLSVKEFLLGKIDATSMNSDWFTWDGSSYEDMPEEEW